jgi:microcystin-dependent protein
VPISEYDVLFNLLGTTYGGNGTTTFGLPDLRGRSPLNAGQGNGLSNHVLGQIAGAENVTLTGAQIGAHSHPLMASARTGTISTPGSSVAIATVEAPNVSVFGSPLATTTLAASAVGLAGASQPHENRQPFLTINYIISSVGIYPSQA